MLRQIAVTNYRSFVDRTTLELRPLTLVFGQNNSGKSALLRLLPWLADSVAEISRGPLDLESQAVRGAPFAEILTRPPLSSRRELELELTWGEGGSALGYDVRVRSFPDLRRDLVVELEVRRGERAVLHAGLDLNFEPGSSQLRYEVTGDGPAMLLRFAGLVPRAANGHVLPAALAEVIPRLEDLRESVQWLGSVRSLPEREVDFWGEAPSLISPEGRGTLELLVADHLRERELLPAVSSWFEEHLDLRLEVEPRVNRFAVTLSPSANHPLRVNLLDTGEGITQVLPVLVAIERAKLELTSRRLLVLEQPELHLHPAAQQALGDYLCRAAGALEPGALVIETHSENLLLSVQLAVVEGRLSRDAVAIYWVRKLQDGRSVVELLPLDELAHPEGWPPEVFRERLEQSRRLVLARREAEQR